MSAAASGFPVFYKVVDPTHADLTGIEVGSRLDQKGRLRGSAQPPSAQWYIKKVGTLISIQPLRGLWVYDPRKTTESALKSNFIIRTQRI